MSLVQYQQGITIVTADGMNAMIQSCDTIAQLRAFIGTAGQQVSVRGNAAVGDGGQGSYYWNANASNPTDDNFTTIVPSGSSSCWSRLPSANVVTFVNVTSGSTYSLTDNIETAFISVANAITVSLPASPFPGEKHTVKDVSGAANTYHITVSPAVDGGSLVISTAYAHATVEWNGTVWGQV